MTSLGVCLREAGVNTEEGSFGLALCSSHVILGFKLDQPHWTCQSALPNSVVPGQIISFDRQVKYHQVCAQGDKYSPHAAFSPAVRCISACAVFIWVTLSGMEMPLKRLQVGVGAFQCWGVPICEFHTLTKALLKNCRSPMELNNCVPLPSPAFHIVAQVCGGDVRVQRHPV